MDSGTDRRLTPDSVQAVDFPPARRSRRGYDKEHVRAFCGHVESELTRLLSERTSLSQEVQRLRRRVLGMSGGGGVAGYCQEAVTGYRQEDVHIRAVNILAQAQQTADRHVLEAAEYSHQLAQDARRQRDQILAEARSAAALVLTEAHGRASEAAQAAMSAPVVPESGEDRRERAAEMAYLRTFSEVYRTHLRDYLDAPPGNREEPAAPRAPALQAGPAAPSGR